MSELLELYLGFIDERTSENQFIKVTIGNTVRRKKMKHKRAFLFLHVLHHFWCISPLKRGGQSGNEIQTYALCKQLFIKLCVKVSLF